MGTMALQSEFSNTGVDFYRLDAVGYFAKLSTPKLRDYNNDLVILEGVPDNSYSLELNPVLNVSLLRVDHIRCTIQ